MGAKAIIARYMERNSSTLPAGSKELREHIVSVAAGAKLKLSEKELDELAPLSVDKSHKRGQNKPQKENAASDTSGDDLKEIESD